jgi:hypothetical protein
LHLIAPDWQVLRAQLAPLIDDEAMLESLSANAARHFVACNRLLDTHVPTPTPLVRCPLVDARPYQSECVFLSSLQHLTRATVHKIELPGTHWTMMFGELTAGVAEAITPFLG